MSKEDEGFKATVNGEYIHLKTWGKLKEDTLDKPANAAIALAKESKITRLLDDIRDVDSSHVPVTLQAKGMGVLWRLRTFEKVAIVSKQEMSWIFLSSLQALHLNMGAKFKGFDNETDAIAWLTED